MTKSEAFLKLLKDENIQQEIKDLYLELNKKSLKTGTMADSNIFKIILDLEGNVDSSYGNINTTDYDVFNKDAIEIAYIHCNGEVSTEEMGDIYDIPINKMSDFKEWLIEESELFEDEDFESEDFETNKEKFLDENLTWDNLYEFDSDLYNEMEQKAWESLCDQYSEEDITSKLNILIEDLERNIKEAEHIETLEKEYYNQNTRKGEYKMTNKLENTMGMKFVMEKSCDGPKYELIYLDSNRTERNTSLHNFKVELYFTDDKYTIEYTMEDDTIVEICVTEALVDNEYYDEGLISMGYDLFKLLRTELVQISKMMISLY